MKHIGIVDVTTVGATLCANEIVFEAQRRGLDDNHPEFTLHAFPFAKYKECALSQKWDEVALLILESIEKLRLVGADFVILPVNTVHYCIDKVIALSPLPVLNLVELTVAECVRKKYKRVAVLGTKMTMQNGLYEKPLLKNRIVPVIPDLQLCEKIHTLIFEILAAKAQQATVNDISSEIRKLRCDAVILGCTELPEVYNEEILKIPAIDTTRLLAHKALDYSLGK